MCTVFSAVCIDTSAWSSDEPVQEIATRSWAGAEQALQASRMKAGVSCHTESWPTLFHSQPD